MKIVYSDDYFGDADFKELRGEDWVGMAENPERMRMILAALADQGLRDVQTPEHHGPEAILRVPDAGFLRFLERAYPMWDARHGRGSAAFARIFGLRGMAQTRRGVSRRHAVSLHVRHFLAPRGGQLEGHRVRRRCRPVRCDGDA